MEECTEEPKDEIFDVLIFDETASMCFDNKDNEEVLEDPKHTKKKGRIFLFGGFSEETFFSLSHAFRVCASCIKHVKKLSIFPGRENDYPIVRIFSLIRCLVACFAALDVTTYCQVEITLFLRLVTEVCRNEMKVIQNLGLKLFLKKQMHLPKFLGLF